MMKRKKIIQQNLLKRLKSFIIDYDDVDKNFSTSSFDNFKLSSTFSESPKFYPNYYTRFNRKERRIIIKYDLLNKL